MKIKSTLSLLLAGLLTAGTASAGGELNFYNWGNYTNPELLEKFTEETGITVNLDGYDSNETMLAKIKELNPNVSTILLTGHADFEFGGAAALQSGKLFQILTKPCPPEKLKNTIEEAIQEYHYKAGDEPDS